MPKKLTFYPDDNLPLDRDYVDEILKHQPRCEIDLREIMTIIKINYNHYNHYHNDPRELDEALRRIFTDKDFMLKVFTDERVLADIIQVYTTFIYQKKRTQDNKATNGIRHEDYDAAVDVVEEFIEIGLDALDEEQLEIYEENLEIVKAYEGS